jgi:hypothetical protein
MFGSGRGSTSERSEDRGGRERSDRSHPRGQLGGAGVVTFAFGACRVLLEPGNVNGNNGSSSDTKMATQ